MEREIVTVIKSSTDIVAMQEEVRVWVEEKGWLDDRTFGDEIALLISEPIEALEAYREHGFEEWTSYQPVIGGVKMPKMTEKQCLALAKEVGLDIVILPNPRREGVAAEFAGTLVRLLDDCCRHNFDLGQAFRDEMDYNWTRTHRHGGKKL